LDGIYLSIQLTDWLLVEVALLFIGLTQISFVSSDNQDSLDLLLPFVEIY
jgi:hypothetical protein